ncbi:MAG TPA: addiction module protein [Gallionellaceae bacterium]|nr:addiction module protein [Gallionellaceae bacterium]
MSTAEVIEQALKLKAAERLALIEMLQESLDKSDPEIDRIWLEEAQRRLQAYREGKLAAIPMEEVFRGL